MKKHIWQTNYAKTLLMHACSKVKLKCIFSWYWKLGKDIARIIAITTKISDLASTGRSVSLTSIFCWWKIVDILKRVKLGIDHYHLKTLNVKAENSSFILQLHVQWNLGLANLYITKSLVERMIFFALVIVKYMEKKLDTMKPPNSEHIFPVPWSFPKSRLHWIHGEVFLGYF